MNALALFALLLAASPAEDARTHFQRGQRLFEREKFREALTEFEAAQKVAPREVAELYFNIGQCNRNLGRIKPAIAAFERYLELKPDAPDRRQVRQVLLTLRTKLPDDDDAEPSDLQGEGTPPPRRAKLVGAPPLLGDPPAAEPVVATPAVAAEPTPPPAPAPAAAPEPKPVKLDLPAPEPTQPAPELAAQTETPEQVPLYRRWWFWAGAGTAFAATVTGLIVATHHGSSSTMQMMPGGPMGSAGTFDTRGGH